MSKQIKYSSEFKIQAVKQHEEGLTPRTIFKLHGFDLSEISKKIPKYCLSRWNKIYRERGEQGLVEENRGKHSKGGGRPKIQKFKDLDFNNLMQQSTTTAVVILFNSTNIISF